MEVIKMHEQEKLSSRTIVERLGVRGLRCGKTQIQSILKRKREWIEEHEGNCPLDRKRKAKKIGYEELNGIVYEWFKDASDELSGKISP